MTCLVEVEDVVKMYKEVVALDGVSLTVEEGKMTALLGSTGSGKTTLLKLISTFSETDKGKIKVCGYLMDSGRNPHIRNSIGFMFDHGIMDRELTVRENLEIRAALYPRNYDDVGGAVKRAAERAEAEAYLDYRYGKLGAKERRCADLARALVGNPRLLIVDEPTARLDSALRRRMWDIIVRLRKEGLTILVSTLYMKEASDCDRVVILHKGRIVATGSPKELKERYSSDKIRFVPKDAEGFERILTGDRVAFSRSGDTFTVEIASTLDALPLLERYREHIEDFEVNNGNMDEVFVNTIRTEGAV
jgi:ABC-type multidrug transport system ATPase subunit